MPLVGVNAKFYANGESHWLADWGQYKPRCARGDIVSFKLQKIYALTSWGHVSNARNINFSELKKVAD